jgi:hypothetical protein
MNLGNNEHREKPVSDDKQNEMIRILFEISDTYWSTTKQRVLWHQDIEFLVWGMVLNSPFPTSVMVQRKIPKKPIERLRVLSKELNGWIFWPRVLPQERFVPMDKWVVMYDVWAKSIVSVPK